MKRAVSYQQLVSINLYRELLACEADVAVDTVLLNVGQKDLATILAVWTDNLSEGHYIGTFHILEIVPHHSRSPSDFLEPKKQRQCCRQSKLGL